MNERNKQGKGKKATLFVALNFVVLLFLVIAFGREYVGSVQIRHEINQLEEQRAQLEGQQLNTLSLIGDLSSEYYLEKEARTKHGLAKEGETLIVIQPNGETTGDVLGATDAGIDFVPNYERWFYYFFDKARLAEDVPL